MSPSLSPLAVPPITSVSHPSYVILVRHPTNVILRLDRRIQVESTNLQDKPTMIEVTKLMTGYIEQHDSTA